MFILVCLIGRLEMVVVCYSDRIDDAIDNKKVVCDGVVVLLIW
jgi:hypothetical protein